MTKTCPICRKNEATHALKPFCSKRCADIDLLKWIKGDYVLEGEQAVTSDEVEHAPLNAPRLS